MTSSSKLLDLCEARCGNFGRTVPAVRWRAAGLPFFRRRKHQHPSLQSVPLTGPVDGFFGLGIVPKGLRHQKPALGASAGAFVVAFDCCEGTVDGGKEGIHDGSAIDEIRPQNEVKAAAAAVFVETLWLGLWLLLGFSPVIGLRRQPLGQRLPVRFGSPSQG